ncbi:MAG: nucleotidyltransferase family protein [Xanthomonadales bacterium]|nr:nucleotidyltransferase family protein [Xanthomonadales bacterium]
MKALVFAAGRGERMRPLTDTTPKPLLPVAGKRLIEWQLERLSAAGIQDVVINIAHLAGQFARILGDGSRWELSIHWCHEGTLPLETGGGMLNALPLLGPEPFIVVNADVWSDYDLRRLPSSPATLAHLVMVDPPGHAQAGDFHLGADGLLDDHSTPRLTYAGIGVYRPEILQGWRGIIGHAPGACERPPRFALTPLLRAAMRDGKVSGEHYQGRWTDVGTPQRLARLEQELAGG